MERLGRGLLTSPVLDKGTLSVNGDREYRGGWVTLPQVSRRLLI